MPGGGKFKTATNVDGSYDINNRGDISFGANLDQDTDHDSVDDTAVYVLARAGDLAAGPRVSGTLKLVVRTGTFIPGVGKVRKVGIAPAPFPIITGGMMNDNGRMLVWVTTTDDASVLLLAHPQD
jgi:hypothetical protein